jgi:hypothetical protein
VPSSADAARVKYPIIRDRFLAAAGSTDRVEWLLAVGRFIEDRWLAEANWLAERRQTDPAAELDEDATWDLWDECSEKQLRDLRTEAAELMQCEIRRRRALALLAELRAKSDPLRTIARCAAWVVKEAVRGFVGAIGIVLMGLLIVWASPKIAKFVRSAVDDNLPAETRPDPRTPAKN